MEIGQRTSPVTQPVIEAKGLRVGYGAMQLLPALDISFHGAALYGICGRNGVGKSSFLKALANLGGRIGGLITLECNGKRFEADEARTRGLMLYLPQRRNCFWEMSVKENVETISRLRWAVAMAEVCDCWEDGSRVIHSFAGRETRTLSGGERQVVAVAALIASRASVLLLDEPSEGLAAQMRKSMYQALRKLVSERRCLILATEQLGGCTAVEFDGLWEMTAGGLYRI